jgi:hypothetical protein
MLLLLLLLTLLRTIACCTALLSARALLLSAVGYLLTIAPSCFRLAPAGLLPPAAAAAPAGFTACGSLALPVTTSNSVGTELICLNSFDLQEPHTHNPGRMRQQMMSQN